MERVDNKKLDTAVIYLRRISDGKNPVNNMPVEEDTVFNDPNFIRCMNFVKEVLEAVQRNNGYIGRKSRREMPYDRGKGFSVSSLCYFTYTKDKPITQFVDQINELIDVSVYRKLNYKIIVDWLKENDYLKVEYNEELSKNVTVPTQKGLQTGIRAEKRVSTSGQTYMVVIYGKQAQEFLVKNMKTILGIAEAEE